MIQALQERQRKLEEDKTTMSLHDGASIVLINFLLSFFFVVY